ERGVLLLQPGPGPRPRRLRQPAHPARPERRAGKADAALDRPLAAPTGAAAGGGRVARVLSRVSECERSAVELVAAAAVAATSSPCRARSCAGAPQGTHGRRAPSLASERRTPEVDRPVVSGCGFRLSHDDG